MKNKPKEYQYNLDGRNLTVFYTFTKEEKGDWVTPGAGAEVQIEGIFLFGRNITRILDTKKNCKVWEAIENEILNYEGIELW